MQSVWADPAAVLQRLQEGDLSLDGVAKNHVEVEMNDLLGLARPMTQRMPIEAQYHPDPVAVHPELSITLGSADDAYAIGLALGTPARLPQITEAVHKLHKGYQPIVESRWKVGEIILDRVAFGVLPEAEAVVTGTEKQDVVIRVSVTNGADAPAATSLVLLTGRADGSQNAGIGYGPFLAPVSRWQHKEMKVTAAPGSLSVDGQMLLAYHCSAPTPVEFLPSFDAVQGAAGKPVVLNNGLRFDLRLQAKETRTIDFIVAGSSRLYPAAERDRLAAVNFEQSLRRAESQWDRPLQSGMKLTTPEPQLNDIYKHLLLSTNMCKEPNTNWIRPIHHFLWPVGDLAVGIRPRLDSAGFPGLSQGHGILLAVFHRAPVGRGQVRQGHRSRRRGANDARLLYRRTHSLDVHHGERALVAGRALPLFAGRRVAEDRSAEHPGRLGLDSEEPRNYPHACGRRQEAGPLRPVAQGAAA